MQHSTLKNFLQVGNPIMFNGICIERTISEEIDLEELKTLDDIRLRKYSDALYFGQITKETGKRAGKGIMKYKNGRTYDGEWRDGVRCGYGHENYSNGNTYNGNYKDGKAHGKGIYTWK